MQQSPQATTPSPQPAAAGNRSVGLAAPVAPGSPGGPPTKPDQCCSYEECGSEPDGKVRYCWSCTDC